MLKTAFVEREVIVWYSIIKSTVLRLEARREVAFGF